MAVRGQESKAIVMEKILSMFDGAFINGKELRIPLTEDNEPIEIKVTLTAAKDCVKNVDISAEEQTTAKIFVEPTQEEVSRMEKLFAKLG